MPPIEVFEPTHKVQLLFELFRRGSRQPRRTARRAPFDRKSSKASKASFSDLPRESRSTASERHPSSIFTSSTLSKHDSQNLVHDRDYYCDPSSATDDQCCTLRVENTLFRVLNLVLCRDNSAFSKRLWFGRKDYGGVFVIPGEADRFRDLLWALHTIPPDFHFGAQSSDSDDHRYTGLHDASLPRLLNIAELAHEYSFPSFQRWAVEKIYRFLLRCSSPESTIPLPSSATSSLSSSMTLVTLDSSTSSKDDDPDEIYGRILKISLTSQHPHLLDLLAQRLVARVLWYNYLPGPALMNPIIENRSKNKTVDTLLGVINYRMLVDLPQVEHRTSRNANLSPPQHIFPPEMPIEQRMEFLAAHHSLTSLWKQVRDNPPELRCQSQSLDDGSTTPKSKRASGSSGTAKRSFLPRGLSRRGSAASSGSESAEQHTSVHASCGNTWKRVWWSSCRYAENRCRNQDDILGMLKVTMLRVRKVTADEGSICLDCALEGLEALDVIRDKVIDGLPDMFVYG